MAAAFDNGGSISLDLDRRRLPSARVLVEIGWVTAAHEKGARYLVTLTEAGTVEEQARRACA